MRSPAWASSASASPPGYRSRSAPRLSAASATASPTSRSAHSSPVAWRSPSASAGMLRELLSGCGAIVAGRRLFDQTDGWGDNHPAGAPVVVVTHRPPPDDADHRFPRTTFTSNVAEAITAAKHIAGDKFVTIASANISQQAINLDMVDELCVSVVPVLFGTGLRY